MSCRSCGHYITGGGCYQSGEQVKVDRNYSCIHFAGKGTSKYIGTINHQQDEYEQRFDKDLPAGYLKPIILDLGA